MFQKEEIDAVTFTSASTVKGFVKAIKNVELQNVSAVCIGEQTAAEARKYGMKIQVAKRVDMDAMTEKIVECFGNVEFKMKIQFEKYERRNNYVVFKQ